MRLSQLPAFEREVRSGAAHFVTARAFTPQCESGVWVRLVACAQLVERVVDFLHPLVERAIVALHICRHHILRQIRCLLNLEDQCTWSEAVEHSRRHIDGIPCLYGKACHYRIVVMELKSVA